MRPKSKNYFKFAVVKQEQFPATQSHCLQVHREFSRTALDLDISHPWLLETRQTHLELFMLIIIIIIPKSVSQQLHSDTTGGTRASANLWVQ